MMRDAVSLDVWHLIFELCTIQDLYQFCLVDKVFNSIATPLLYRSISLIPYYGTLDLFRSSTSTKTKTDPESPRGHWLLLSRLEHEENDDLRAWVQEIIISHPPSTRANDSFLKRLQSNDCLAELVARLPNLRRVSINIPRMVSSTFIRTICGHSRKPELLLSNQRYGNKIPSLTEHPLPCVTTLSVFVDPYSDRDGPNRDLLTVQKWFFNCPHLRSFSLTIVEQPGGCVIRMPRHPVILEFQLTGEETFPPLEHLALDGYKLDDQQWNHWRDGLQWDKLVSLSVGPQRCPGLFHRLAGYARSLKSLNVCSWKGEGDVEREGLTELLSSFDSLETLNLKSFICPVEAIIHHSNLSTLCLHEEETASKERLRQVLTAEELGQLDSACPKLKSLQVGVKRDNEQWPTDVFDKLATGFHNLRSLSLHFELGLADIYNPIKPLINYASVRSIGQQFFDRRRQAGVEVSESFTLTVRTGSYIRHYNQRLPMYARFERRFTATYEICLSRDFPDEVKVRHLEKERLDLIASNKIRADISDDLYLSRQVAAAVDGPIPGKIEG